MNYSEFCYHKYRCSFPFAKIRKSMILENRAKVTWKELVSLGNFREMPKNLGRRLCSKINGTEVTFLS